MDTDRSELHLKINKPEQTLEFDTWVLSGNHIVTSEKRLKDLRGLFADKSAAQNLDPETPVYTVRVHSPVADGSPGGLFFGSTTVEPGRVGKEYFMTRGHFHAKPERAEYYWGVKGEGILILMDEERVTWAEEVFPGSLHYIPGHVAHRLANTGSIPLTVGACWHSDAGHDYEKIDRDGFSARLLEAGGIPKLVEVH